MTDEKTPEQIRLEMYKNLMKKQGSGEHLCEVATPGVYRPVNDSEVKPDIDH